MIDNDYGVAVTHELRRFAIRMSNHPIDHDTSMYTSSVSWNTHVHSMYFTLVVDPSHNQLYSDGLIKPSDKKAEKKKQWLTVQLNDQFPVFNVL